MEELNNFKFVSRHVAFTFFNLMGKYQNKRSLFDIMLMTLVVELRLYINDGEFEIEELSKKLLGLIEGWSLNLNEEEYDLSGWFDTTDLTVNMIVLGLSFLAAALNIKADCEDATDDEIYATIRNEAAELKKFIDEQLNDISAIRESEIVRIHICEAMEMFEDDIPFGANDAAIKYESIKNLKNYHFVDFDIEPLGDGFTTTMFEDFFKRTDGLYDHQKEHDEYLNYIKNNSVLVKDTLLSNDPKLCRERVILGQRSDDPEDICVSALCYLYGVFVEQNIEHAFYLFKDASALLHPQATYQLSVFYLKSLFVKYDIEDWLFYLAKACRLGEENAISQWKEIEETYRQIKETYPQYFTK